VLANLGLVPLLKLPERFDELPARVPLPLIWEASVALESGALEMLELTVRDGTQGLVRQGIVRAALPTRLALSAPANDVRANLRAGVGDTPPRIDDPERSARLVGWLRMRPRHPAQVTSLALSWAGVNAIAIEQRQSVFGRVIGVSDASPGQSFQLPGTSVERATLELEVEEGGSFQRWQCVDDFATLERNPSVAREARAFVLDAEAGVLRFGDGVRGRVPERGARIRAARLRFGGGRAGNLPPGTLAKLSATDLQGDLISNLKLQQPMALAGGEDAETLAQAEQRIPARLRHGDRVVTPEDYRRLTLDTPGVQVGRVEVLPRFKPQQRRAGVPGVVSVMALPAQPIGEPPNPRPDRVFLETVHAWLDARRPLATELYVIGCEYVALGIALAVEIREGFEQDGVLQAVRDALRRLLWPLAPGGPQSGTGPGEGWPLGRSVRDREVEVEVSRVAGVASVSEIKLFARRDGRWEALPALDACGAQQLDLEAWQLPELLGVVVVPGVTAPADLRTPPAEVDPDAVGVPVVPEVC
jgi:predicted phage baseplate assembly protein